ncbi:MAG: YiiD C-terminal domain-containing protein [Planctomycetota bacterium]
MPDPTPAAPTPPVKPPNKPPVEVAVEPPAAPQGGESLVSDSPGPTAEERDALQRVLETEIPMAASMGVRVEPAGGAADGLAISMPLDRNRNHQQTAFAGSLNALCTLVGWGMTYLEMRRLGLAGVIVIRRSSIKYHRPVNSTTVRAACAAVDAERRQFFREMMQTKGQSKLDVEVTVSSPGDGRPDDGGPGEGGPDDGGPGDGQAVRPAVIFSGCYVVLPDE